MKSSLFLLLLCGAYYQAGNNATGGDLDTTFGTGGVVLTDVNAILSRFVPGGFEQISALALQTDGKIVAAGYCDLNPMFVGIYEFALARYNNDGTLDSSFGTGGIVVTNVATLFSLGVFTFSEINSIALQTDGKIVAGGYTSDILANFALARYNADGTLDSSFGTGGVVVTNIATVFSQSPESCRINSIALQTDGKIVAGGLSTGGALANFALARYNTDGTLDSSFGTGGVVVINVATVLSQSPQACLINSIALQTDGKIVAGGLRAGALDNFALARYNTDGTLDSSFGTGGVVVTNVSPGHSSDISSIVLQSDGKIVAAGYLSFVRTFALARYNTDGTLDSSFGTGGLVVGPEGTASAVALDPFGNIIVAGATNGIRPSFLVVCYKPDGTRNAGFGTGGIVSTNVGTVVSMTGTAGNAIAVAIQPDGKIIAAGESSLNNGYDNYVFALARYDGVDTMIPDRVVCTSCGPFLIGKRGCKDILVYNRFGVCVERLFGLFRVPQTVLNGGCTDFMQVTTVCNC
jgi:uncharacterized delta-60 repeat protein